MYWNMKKGWFEFLDFLMCGYIQLQYSTDAQYIALLFPMQIILKRYQHCYWHYQYYSTQPCKTLYAFASVQHLLLPSSSPSIAAEAAVWRRELWGCIPLCPLFGWRTPVPLRENPGAGWSRTTAHVELLGACKSQYGTGQWKGLCQGKRSQNLEW